MADVSNYQNLRESSERFYKSVGHVYSPAFKETVRFDAEGFNHLIYKKGNSERSKEDQITKFKLLSSARKLVELSTTFQEFDQSLMTIRRKRFKKRVEETVTVTYWGLVAIIENNKLKVIIRQVGNGAKHFWSVIPAWRRFNYRDIKLISKASGDLSDD